MFSVIDNNGKVLEFQRMTDGAVVIVMEDGSRHQVDAGQLTALVAKIGRAHV